MLAERMNTFSGSPTSALIAKVAELRAEGKDIISLNVGEPDFGTPDYIKCGAIKAIVDNFSKYTAGNGIIELRRLISKKLHEDNNLEYTTDEICATVGAKQAIFNSIMALVDPGDEVLLPVPCWVSYTEMIKFAGAKPVFVDVEAETFDLDIEALEKAVTTKTKAIVICTPNNPTGAVYSEGTLRKLADLACKYDFYIITDEIYAELTYDEPFTSIASIGAMRDRTIIVSGFSKGFAMTGWRLGYCCGPEVIISQMTKLHQFAIMCAPTNSQYAAVQGLRNCGDEVEEMRKSYNQRRRFLMHEFKKMGLECFEPFGAFYVFPSIKQFGMTSEEFATRLLNEEKVAVVPGTAFGECGEGFLRISYAYSLEDLKEAIGRLERFIGRLRNERK